MWVIDNEVFVNREITYVPGLYKIFDEILGKCHGIQTLFLFCSISYLEFTISPLQWRCFETRIVLTKLLTKLLVSSPIPQILIFLFI